jgi:hypothetical protein
MEGFKMIKDKAYWAGRYREEGEQEEFHQRMSRKSQYKFRDASQFMFAHHKARRIEAQRQCRLAKA